MKYYIATSLSQQHWHNLLRDHLNKMDYQLTYDWTEHGSVKLEGENRLRQVAYNEMKGIQEADFVVGILPGGAGTHCELGLSIAWNKPLFLITEDPSLVSSSEKTCAFYYADHVYRKVGNLQKMPPFIMWIEDLLPSCLSLSSESQ